MIRIDIYFNEGTTTQGKKYKVPHTTAFGYDCTVQLNNCKQTSIEWDATYETYYIVYNPAKAGMKVNDRGYLTLHITD